MPVIRKFLDVSIAHCPPEWRDGRGIPGIVAYPTEYGLFMWVPDDPEESAANGEDAPPLELITVQLYARRHGCDYVLFDSDAEQNKDLDVYEGTCLCGNTAQPGKESCGEPDCVCS